MELPVIQELVQTLGPMGAIAVILGWWFMSHREKRNGTADTEARLKARDTIVEMSVDVKHMQQDIAEIKEDGKETTKVLLSHIASHPSAHTAVGDD